MTAPFDPYLQNLPNGPRHTCEYILGLIKDATQHLSPGEYNDMLLALVRKLDESAQPRPHGPGVNEAIYRRESWPRAETLLDPLDMLASAAAQNQPVTTDTPFLDRSSASPPPAALKRRKLRNIHDQPQAADDTLLVPIVRAALNKVKGSKICEELADEAQFLCLLRKSLASMGDGGCEVARQGGGKDAARTVDVLVWFGKVFGDEGLDAFATVYSAAAGYPYRFADAAERASPTYGITSILHSFEREGKMDFPELSVTETLPTTIGPNSTLLSEFDASEPLDHPNGTNLDIQHTIDRAIHSYRRHVQTQAHAAEYNFLTVLNLTQFARLFDCLAALPPDTLHPYMTEKGFNLTGKRSKTLITELFCARLWGVMEGDASFKAIRHRLHSSLFHGRGLDLFRSEFGLGFLALLSSTKSFMFKRYSKKIITAVCRTFIKHLPWSITLCKTIEEHAIRPLLHAGRRTRAQKTALGRLQGFRSLRQMAVAHRT